MVGFVKLLLLLQMPAYSYAYTSYRPAEPGLVGRGQNEFIRPTQNKIGQKDAKVLNCSK